MRQLIAFTKKEWMEILRNGKFILLMIIFILFGIMNPAIAKLTPWFMEMASEEMAEAGLILTEIEVDAMTSWTQFYKNVPMALIVFVLMFSGILTWEYQKGTLINMITKGLARWKIIVAKSIIMFVLWSLGYWLCYGITYAYNAYFWDNDIAKHILFSAFCIYVMGIWLISLIVLISVFTSSASAVSIGTGTVFFGLYLLSMLPDIEKYLPVKLLSASQLLMDTGKVGDYYWALVIVVVLIIVNGIIALAGFNQRKM